jgi:hypothetical protein
MKMSEVLPTFRKPNSKGWLVLSNRIPSLGDDTPMLMERMLALIDLSYPPLCLTLGSDDSEAVDEFLDDYETLTGVEMTVIDLWDLSHEEMITAVSQASFVIFTGGLALDWVAQIDPQGSGDSAADFFQQERMIMAIGPVVASLGSWVYSPLDGDIKPGLDWIPNAVVLPDEAAPMGDDRIQALLAERERAYAIGLPHDSIFALGPQGNVEVWSATKPVIALGKGWSEA